MSEEEKEKLKEEIKKEIFNEVANKQLIRDNAWKSVKEQFERMFYSKGYGKEGTELYKIMTACSTIVRMSLGYRQIQSVPYEKEEEMRQIMFKLLNLFPKKEN